MSGLSNREKFRRHGEVGDFLGVIRKFEIERVELKTVTGANASVDYVATDEAFARKYAINGANRVRMTFDAKTASLAGGETVTATVYHRKKDSDDFFIVGTLTGTVPAVSISSNKVRGAVEFSDTLGILKKATHIGITGATITVATGCVCDFGLEMWNEDEISIAGDGLATETTLSTMNAKVPSLGQALAASCSPVVLPALQVADLKKTGGGTDLTNASGASGANLLAAHATLKRRIWKLFIRAGASTSVTLSDSAGVFGTDASGNCVVDLNPIGSLQGTAATAITITTGDASAWTATVIHSAE